MSTTEQPPEVNLSDPSSWPVPQISPPTEGSSLIGPPPEAQDVDKTNSS